MYRNMTDHLKKLARELPYGAREIGAVADLLDGGATLPFIARYRKEATGGLDEVAIAEIRDQLSRLRQLDERRTAIIRSLAKRDLLTSDLNDKLQAAETLAQLEDIYLPFRPKRRTRATVAKERGLEPLAQMIFAQDSSDFLDPEEEAASFVDAEKGVASIEEALIGAKDIMAEWISEDVEARTRMRALFQAEGVLRTQATADAAANASSDAGKFRDYMNLSEPISHVSSHRLLAMLRGEKMGLLSLHIAPA